MKLEKIIELVSGLSTEDQCMVMQRITENIHRKSGHIRERAKIADVAPYYIVVMNDIMGIDILANRKRDSIFGKHCVEYALYMRGYKEREIAPFLGIKRSSVNHGKMKMMDVINYPALFREESNIWNEFKTRIEL